MPKDIPKASAMSSPTPPTQAISSTSPKKRVARTTTPSTPKNQALSTSKVPNNTLSISTKVYRSLKNKLKRSESSNYDSIFMIPCSGNNGWYEIAEHSALLYYYEVCQNPKLQLSPNFFSDDTSFYNQYEIGYLRTKNPHDICDNIKTAGLYESESQSGAIYIVKLNTKFTPEHLKELQGKERGRRLSNLTPGKTDNLDPALHQALISLGTRLHRICSSHLDKLSSHVNGVRILNLSDNLLISYYHLTYYTKSDTAKIRSTLETMRRDIYNLTIEIQILGSLKLWSLEVCASLALSLEKIRDYIEADLKRIIKKGEL